MPQYQYQPVTGPVWREPVADRLTWLPVANYAPRALPQPVRPGIVIDPFPQVAAPTYNPALLDWLTRVTLIPRSLPYIPRVPFVVIADLYDPQILDWLPRREVQPRGLAAPSSVATILDPFPRPSITFDPSTLSWIPAASFIPRGLPFGELGLSLLDPLPLPTITYDPATMGWMPSMNLIIRRLESGRVSWFVTDPTIPTPPVTTHQSQRRRRWHRSTSG